MELVFNSQPILETSELQLLPLQIEDFEALYKVASDPEIWKQHPNKDRWKKEVFAVFFDGAIKSGGAFKIVEKESQKIIGSTRFYDFDPKESLVLIGYTFYAVSHWGTELIHSIKELMFTHAFKYVSQIQLHIGAENIRSQMAIERLGAQKIGSQEVAYYGEPSKLNYVYQVTKNAWENSTKLKNK